MGYNITNVRFSKDYPIAITLTWFDPIDAASTGRLVNDLDLKLISPSNKIYYGGANSFLGGQTQQYAPPAITYLSLNTPKNAQNAAANSCIPTKLRK